MMHLNEFLDAENAKSRKFVNRRKNYYDEKNNSFYKFRKFFEQLAELPGIYVGIFDTKEANWSSHAHWSFEPYKIKYNELERTKIDFSIDGYRIFSIKSLNTIVHLLIDDDTMCFALDDASAIKNSSFILYLFGLEKDEVDELCKVGFSKADDAYASVSFDKIKDKSIETVVCISFPDLLANINTIYRTVFEFTE